MIIKEENEDNKLSEFDKALKEVFNVSYPFYMLHVYSYLPNKLTDERSWFTGKYRRNDEEYYGFDKIDLYYGIRYALDRFKHFRKFKTKSAADRVANELNEWNGLYEIKVEKIESVEDLFL